MRIVLHGQQAFGQSILERLLERGEDVVAVCCAPVKEGRPDDVLAAFAMEKGLPVHRPKSWKTPEALDLMKSFDADVCMMAYVLLFVPEDVLNAPKYGTFQYHPSLCPFHRGPSSINWPIAMGRDRTGLTIFWPNSGLDEGPIMIQKTCKIESDETLGDVYFKKLFPMGVEAMLEGLDLVKSGVIIKHDQRIEDGSYEGWYGKNEAAIDWSEPAATVYNKIRAANPAPGAWTTFAGEVLKIYDSILCNDDGDGRIGEIISIEDEGLTVQAQGGRILVKRIRFSGEKIPAFEWASRIGVKVGEIIGEH